MIINQARTLLLNLNGAGNGFSGHPGEEFIPPDYIAATLPSFLLAVRNVLFGPLPDRALLNYRARQLLGLLHVTELAEFVTELDPRVTYDVLPADQLYNDLFTTTVTPLGVTDKQLFIQGRINPNDSSGRVEQQWTVRVTSGSSAEVTRNTAPLSVTVVPYTITSGLSSSVALTGSDLSVKFAEGVGSEWYITTATRPGTDLGTLMASVDALSEPIKLELFGVGSPQGATEPFLTFYNLYKMHPELPYRLGGILLALIYQTNLL